MRRLFAALRPPPAIRTLLLAAMGGVPGARWKTDDQLHLTLRYIGEVDTRMAEDIAAMLACLPAAPASVAICGVGAFEKQGRTCALWAGIAPADQLSALHRKVDHALTVPGLSAKSRVYVPHITLARLARLQAAEPMIAAYLAHHAGLRSPVFTFTHMTLFESHLGHGGAHYEAVGSWPFG